MATHPVKALQIKPLTVEDIPNCSMTDQVILELITDNDVDLDQLAGMIEENPSLTALIVGLANSAYFSSPNPIHSVKDAIVKVLGMRMVRSVVLSVLLGRSLDTSRCPNFSAADYWTDCLTVARMCQLLTIKSDFKKAISVDQVYLCSLLAGFGQLLLIDQYPEIMYEVIEMSAGGLDEAVTGQSELLGINQCEAGVLLARRWVLPPMAINTMHHYLDPLYRGQDWALCHLVGDVSRQVNKAAQGGREFTLSEESLKLLCRTEAELDLDLIAELRQEFMAVAQQLANGS